MFRLRPGEALYNTTFLGEHAHDAGGPYRESFAQYCAELQSAALPLLVRCPNGVNEAGINREKWVPSPGASSPLALAALSFLGRLMGVAIRTRQPLDLDLPPMVWKQLVRSPLSREDLEAVDCLLVSSLKAIRAIHRAGVTVADFADLGLGGFTTTTVDGRVAEVIQGGAAQPLTFENRHEYARLVEAYKMDEFRPQVEAIRRGLGEVVPGRLLPLFCWDELESLVCGSKEVDVEWLRERAEYSGCLPRDEHVRTFWHVLTDFSTQDRALFLRFVWGRSRLPVSADRSGGPHRFKVQAFSRGGPPDLYLPVAHTCFFSLELPRYSSRAVMEARLRYAIHNCREIDADDTSVGRSAANLGWEAEEEVPTAHV